METPLLLGRLRKVPNGRCSLLGHTGDVRPVPDSWFNVLRAMDGFHSFDEISDQNGISGAQVRTIFDSMRGEKRLGTLEEWNQCFWCGTCRTYLSHSQVCPECGSPSRQVPWLPPCDPWILLEEEHQFVSQALHENAGVEIDADRLLLANNGIRNNRFFWQIAFDGQIVLHIDFGGTDPSTWRFSATSAAREVDWQRKSEGRDVEIRRMIAANRDTLRLLEEESIAFLDEVCAYYPTDPLLYFSGGKESMVMLRLLEKASRKANLAFVGTGLDFPEDAQFLLNELKPSIDQNPMFRLETNVASPELFLGAFEKR